MSTQNEIDFARFSLQLIIWNEFVFLILNLVSTTCILMCNVYDIFNT